MERSPSESHLFEAGENSPSKWVKAGAIVCAIAFAAALFLGYRFLRARQLEQMRATQGIDRKAKTTQPPEAQIFEDEARLKGSQALIGGTVRNISGKILENLSLEIELKSRLKQGTEIRKIKIEPSKLASGEAGRYALSLPSGVWSGARVLRLNSAQRDDALVFQILIGERRPLERLPQGGTKVVVPRPTPPGEEFINTPDTPVRIP